MPKANKNDERKLAAMRQRMDRYRVALSVLARGDDSPHMTEEFKRQLADAQKKLAAGSGANSSNPK